MMKRLSAPARIGIHSSPGSAPRGVAAMPGRAGRFALAALGCLAFAAAAEILAGK